ncbi:MAG: D-alanine--D-alanine ligase [Chloroflexi bacterium]|nr:D-alanine--D-alanine ligase [Chloroflexota bacterium]
MDKLKISILFWEDHGNERIEHDEVVDEVAKALLEGEHKVSLIGINRDLVELLHKLDEKQPDLVFNLCERFADNDDYEMHITAVLAMLGQPFTGTGPAGMVLRQDKAITKKILKFHGVHFPNFATFDKDSIEFAGKMRFPLFVKPLHGDTSLGIDDSSVVTEYSKLVERISFIQTHLKIPALVEEYIEGREFYVGILGNEPAEILPVMELDFAKLPDGHPRIYGHEAKSDIDSPQYSAVNVIVATDLHPEVRARIIMASREAVYALKVQDYARVDIRLSADGIPMIVEVNANPYLEQTSAFPLAALQAGMGYTTLINRIVAIAMNRWKSTPFLKILKELQKSGAGRDKIRKHIANTVKSHEKIILKENPDESIEKPAE